MKMLILFLAMLPAVGFAHYGHAIKYPGQCIASYSMNCFAVQKIDKNHLFLNCDSSGSEDYVILKVVGNTTYFRGDERFEGVMKLVKTVDIRLKNGADVKADVFEECKRGHIERGRYVED